MRTGTSDAFEHLDIGRSVCRGEGRVTEFFGEPVAFGAEDPDVKRLEEVGSVGGKASERDTFAGSKVDELPGQM